MPPKEKKKKVAKPPPYQTGAADLAPWGVQVGQLVRNSLGCTGTVLGVRLSPSGTELWVRWSSGLDAPVDASGGVQPASGADQLRRDIDVRQQEAAALAAKWQAYNQEQERKAAEAQKAAAKKMKKKAPEGGAAAAAADAAGSTGQPLQGGPASQPASSATTARATAR